MRQTAADLIPHDEQAVIRRSMTEKELFSLTEDIERKVRARFVGGPKDGQFHELTVQDWELLLGKDNKFLESPLGTLQINGGGPVPFIVDKTVHLAFEWKRRGQQGSERVFVATVLDAKEF